VKATFEAALEVPPPGVRGAFSVREVLEPRSGECGGEREGVWYPPAPSPSSSPVESHLAGDPLLLLALLPLPWDDDSVPLLLPLET
jgi:hypothetical protein